MRERIFREASAERVIAGGTWTILAGAAFGLVPLIVIIAGSRVFGPTGIEYYTTAWAVTGVVELVAMGLCATYVRWVSEAHERDPEEARVIASTATLFTVVVGICLSAVFFLLITLLIHDPADRLAFSFIAMTVPLLYLRDPMYAMLQAMHRYDYYSFMFLGGFAGLGVVAGYLLWLKNPAYAPYLASTVPVFTACSWAVVAYFFRKVSPFPYRFLISPSNFDLGILKRFLGSSIWITASSLVPFGALVFLSTTLAKILVPLREWVGIFGVVAGYTWAFVVVTNMALPLVPELARARERRDRRTMEESTRAVLKWTFGMGALVIILFLVIAELLLYSFNGPAFVKGSNLLRILNAGMIMFAVATVFGQILVGLGREVEAGRVFLPAYFMFVVGPCLTKFLAPHFGIQGELSLGLLDAYSISVWLLISGFLASVILFRRALETLEMGFDWPMIGRVLLASVISLVLGLCLVPSWGAFNTSWEALGALFGGGIAVALCFFFLLVFLGHYDEFDYRMIEGTAEGIHPSLLPPARVAIHWMRKIASLNPLLRR